MLVSPSLLCYAWQLDLASNQLCGVDQWGDGTYDAEGITAIAGALRVMGSVTELSIDNNCVGDEGAGAICEAIQCNKETKLVSLNLGNNGIGQEGAESVAAMLAVVGSMTHLDVSGNFLGEEGKAALRRAIHGSSEFELML